MVSETGQGDSLSINADANIYRLQLQENEHLTLSRDHNRWGYLHIIEGEIIINSKTFSSGDGIGLTQTKEISIYAQQPVVALWFDLPSGHPQ